jgi:hypothetical protein
MAYKDPTIPDKALDLSEENDNLQKLEVSNTSNTEKAMNWEDPGDIGHFPSVIEEEHFLDKYNL